MKTMGIIIMIAGCFTLGCAYNCDANKKPHCADIYPPGPVTGPGPGPCNEQHQRWFYSPSTNECERVTYWGCNGYGFGSKEDCEKCRCYNN